MSLGIEELYAAETMPYKNVNSVKLSYVDDLNGSDYFRVLGSHEILRPY